MITIRGDVTIQSCSWSVVSVWRCGVQAKAYGANVLTLVIDLTVAVDVGLADHLVDLLVGELLAEVGHDVAQLSRRYEPVAVLVEDTECFADFLLAIRVLHFAGHHRQEFGEIYRAVAWNSKRVDVSFHNRFQRTR